jgi:hypothetical protein
MAEPKRIAFAFSGFSRGQGNCQAGPDDQVAMGRGNLPAHLITAGGAQRCSVCDLAFSKGIKPTQSRAFTQHVDTVRRTIEHEVRLPPGAVSTNP